MFACKDIEEAIKLDKALKMGSTYQLLQSYAYKLGYKTNPYYLNWMINSCIKDGLELVVKSEHISNSKATMILKKLLSFSNVVKYLCFKDLKLSQEQIAILQGLLECIESD